MTLVAAILSLLLLPCRWPVQHARHYPGGVDAKAAALAEHIDQAAQIYDLDPYLLVALAYSESGLDGTRVGPLGEVSLMQLLPHSRAGREYTHAKGNQAERDGLAVFLGAEALHQGVMVCGNELSALAWYKSGRCLPGPKARFVLALRNRLRGGRS